MCRVREQEVTLHGEIEDQKDAKTVAYQCGSRGLLYEAGYEQTEADLAQIPCAEEPEGQEHALVLKEGNVYRPPANEEEN